MEWSHWLTLAFVCLMGAISPGPSLALMVRNSVQGGRGYGVVTALGHGLGVAIYALASAMGLSLLLTQIPLLFEFIRYTGALFLAWLGLNALLAKPSHDEPTMAAFARHRRGAWEGFMVAFLNPQLALFFIALFSQFVHGDMDFAQGLIMMATVSGIDTLWYMLVACLLTHGAWLNWFRRKAVLIDKLSGVALLGLAFKVVL